MSRIDEALRRAECDEPGSSVAIQPGAAGPSVLDRYIPERPSSVRSSPGRAAVERQRTSERPVDPTWASTAKNLSAVPDATRATTPPIMSDHLAIQAFGGRLVSSSDIDPMSLEQYRRMAAVLDAMQAERGLKCLMITSAFPREGKTLTATNLAITLSETYKRRVVLMDADLRRPSVHELLRVPNEPGLTDLLRAPGAPLTVVPVSATLAVVPAGRANASPIAALSSERMKAIVAEAVTQFDWVLLDTPPVGLLTDAQLLARVAEAVLLVVGAGTTPYHMVQRTIADLGAERIVGTVLNRADRHAVPTGEYYGHYYPSHQ